MAFNIRESRWGLNHIWLGTLRSICKMPATKYMKRYADNGISVEPAQNESGNLICCNVCGFVLIKAKMDKDWTLQMCSALPVVSLKDSKFKDWFQKLADPNELSNSDISTYTSK